MIKQKYLSRLNSNLGKLVQRHGLSHPIVIEQGGEDVGIVEVSKELHEKFHDKIDGILDDFIGGEGITIAHDEHFGTSKIKKGHHRRYFIFAVAEDQTYESDDDKKIITAMQERMASSDYEIPDPKTGLYKIPPAAKNAPNQVYLTLAYDAFDAIKSGKKVTEFRAYTPRYIKMLLSKPPKTVKFQRGYGKGAEQMVWTVKTVDLYNIQTRMSAKPGSEPKDFRPTHIAIDLAKRIDEIKGKVGTSKR